MNEEDESEFYNDMSRPNNNLGKAFAIVVMFIVVIFAIGLFLNYN